MIWVKHISHRERPRSVRKSRALPRCGKALAAEKARLNELLSKHTKQPVERIERDTDRDRYLSADEAKEYGLVDNVITNRGEIIEPSALAAVTK